MKKLFLLLLMPNILQAATTITARVTGTSNPSALEYMSLTEAVTTYAKNMVSADEIYHINITSAFVDSVACEKTGYTTDAGHYIYIYTSGVARSTGSWDNSKYTRTAYLRLPSGMDYVAIDGLQCGSGGGINYAYYHTSDSVTIRNCYFKDSSVTYNSISGVGGHLYLYNCVFRYTGTDNYFDWNVFDQNGKNVDYIYNCVFDGGGYNNVVVASSSQTFKNCVVYNQGSSRSCFATNTGGDKYNVTDSTKCIASDATGPSPELNSISVANINSSTFVDSVRYDYHLQALDPYAKGKGYPVSGDAYMKIFYDIDGHAYNMGAWDIGIDNPSPASASGPGISLGGGVRLGN